MEFLIFDFRFCLVVEEARHVLRASCFVLRHSFVIGFFFIRH